MGLENECSAQGFKILNAAVNWPELSEKPSSNYSHEGNVKSQQLLNTHAVKTWKLLWHPMLMLC